MAIAFDIYGAMGLADLLQSSGDALWHLLDVDDAESPSLQERFLLETKVQIGEECHSIGALVTLMWDPDFNVREGEYGRLEVLAHWLGQTTNLQRYLMTAHGSVSGTEKLQTDRKPQEFGATWRATAFGERDSEHDRFEPIDLDKLRGDLLSQSAELVQAVSKFKDQPDVLSKELCKRRAELEKMLLRGLGETRRPDNDVTLWDYVFSIASLYKSALAQRFLAGNWLETAGLRWRLLHVSFDGLAFWSQSHHVTDMLGRRQVLKDGLDAVRDLLEVQYSVGNEIYRDEHGSVLVVPDVEDLLEQTDKDGKSLRELLREAFDARGMRGELVPEIEISGPYEGKRIDLAGVLQTRRRANAPRPEVVANWWPQGAQRAEVCTVCGERPVGYLEPGLDKWVTSQKAKDRNVCGVCLGRRGRRARDWARNKKVEGEKLGYFERTIWVDEVADNNGRFALVVGRFVLDGWLDGKLMPTMLKSSSFARIRRCWDTTRQFWLEVQNDALPGKLERRLRFGIRPTNAAHLRGELGSWHNYETEVGGRRLGLCWDPTVSRTEESQEETVDRDLFWTTNNLSYLAAQIETSVEGLEGHIQGRKLPLYTPGGYLGQDRRLDVDAEGMVAVHREVFYPFVPLLVEPATFMALVPADKAIEVAVAIQAKYDQEMARVRDRLPLHLGLVFAPRRTPMSAVLEAGRAMLAMPDEWETWQVEAAGRQARFSRNGQAFVWTYPAKLGDDETGDVWYPHLLTYEPDKRLKEKREQDLVAEGEEPELKKQNGDFRLVDNITGSVFIRPSRFDFEFLDTTARRFEIHYDQGGRRPRHTRPFLLDDLGRLERLWEEMKCLEKSQRHQAISTIEGAREDWFGTDAECRSWSDAVFRRFVHDTLAGATWPEGHSWRSLDQGLREQLVEAGVTGQLADWAELHMQTLKE